MAELVADEINIRKIRQNAFSKKSVNNGINAFYQIERSLISRIIGIPFGKQFMM